MGIIDQVESFLKGDRAESRRIAQDWHEGRCWGNADFMAERLATAKVIPGDGISVVVGSDRRLAAAYEQDPQAVAAAGARISPTLSSEATQGPDAARVVANRMVYDIALSRMAKEALKDAGTIRVPTEMYDLVGGKANEIASAVAGLDRPMQERLASGSMERLPIEFLEKVAEPLPRLDRRGPGFDGKEASKAQDLGADAARMAWAGRGGVGR